MGHGEQDHGSLVSPGARLEIASYSPGVSRDGENQAIRASLPLRRVIVDSFTHGNANKNPLSLPARATGSTDPGSRQRTPECGPEVTMKTPKS
jgi:hypothetical protein